MTATYLVSKLSIVTKACELVKGVVRGEARQVNTLREASESELQQGEVLSQLNHRKLELGN